MRGSTAQQLDLDGLGQSARPWSSVSDTFVGRANASDGVAPLNIPNFGEGGQLFALTARLAARKNAAAISEEERCSLLLERQALLDRKFDGGITRKEAIRLQYIRWTLDRIDDARHGATLDKIEDAVLVYEKFVSDIAHLTEQLNKYKGNQK